MSKPEDTWKYIAEIEAATPTPEEDTLDDDLAFGFRHFGQALEAQRQSDLEKISFHAGIDLKTLQGYLESGVTK